MGLGLKFSCTWPQCGGVKQYTLAHHQVQTCKEHRGVKQYNEISIIESTLQYLQANYP